LIGFRLLRSIASLLLIRLRRNGFGIPQRWLASRAPLVGNLRLSPEDLTEHRVVDRQHPRVSTPWIGTTTKNESLRVLKSRRRIEPADPMADSRFDSTDRPELDEDLIRADQRRALREGLRQSRPEHRQLLLLLLADPRLSYHEISRRLGIPIGSIGPTRARCLRRLRATTEVHALTAA